MFFFVQFKILFRNDEYNTTLGETTEKLSFFNMCETQYFHHFFPINISGALRYNSHGLPDIREKLSTMFSSNNNNNNNSFHKIISIARYFPVKVISIAPTIFIANLLLFYVNKACHLAAVALEKLNQTQYVD